MYRAHALSTASFVRCCLVVDAILGFFSAVISTHEESARMERRPRFLSAAMSRLMAASTNLAPLPYFARGPICW